MVKCYAKFAFVLLLYAILRKSQAVRRKFIKRAQFFSDCIGAGSLPPRLMKTEGSRWLTGMIERGVHRNAIVVALANKLARIAWAALRKEATFERGYPVAA